MIERHTSTVVNPATPSSTPSCADNEASGDTMVCLTCTHLRQAFESKVSKYIEARSAAYYRVSTELAAHKNVDMERARNDLEEYQFVCLSAKVRGMKPQDFDVCAIF
jgi:hypothetical protein